MKNSNDIAPPGRPSLLYDFLRGLCMIAAKLYFRAEARGVENVPEEGPCLLLANHASFLDPVLVGGLVPRQMHYLARSEVVNWPVLGRLMRNTHAIRRGGVDREAIGLCSRILEAGWPLTLFPEGTRSPDDCVQPARGGFAMIVERVPGVPCVPVYVEGTHRALGRGMAFPRPAKVRVHYGAPFRFPPRDPATRRRDYYEQCAARLDKEWRRLREGIES